MKLLGIVILYYPEDDIVANINSYIEDVDELIVWYNSSSNIKIPEHQKIVSMGDGTNVGLGKALNEAVKYAKINGFTHLLTMDQDSHFEKDHFLNYISLVEKASEKTIFAPNCVVYGQQMHNIQDDFVVVECCGQSGSIYPVDVFDETGLFREDFFVDGVDIDMNYRSGKYGILTKIITPILLHHQLGSPKTKHNFLGISISSNERSAVRSYYIVRNDLLVHKFHPKHDTDIFYNFYKRLFLVVFFEKDKKAKLKGLIMGYFHGKSGKTGIQTILK
jgi:rhamnosyltransferase